MELHRLPHYRQALRVSGVHHNKQWLLQEMGAIKQDRESEMTG